MDLLDEKFSLQRHTRLGASGTASILFNSHEGRRDHHHLLSPTLPVPPHASFCRRFFTTQWLRLDEGMPLLVIFATEGEPTGTSFPLLLLLAALARGFCTKHAKFRLTFYFFKASVIVGGVDSQSQSDPAPRSGNTPPRWLAYVANGRAILSRPLYQEQGFRREAC